MISVCISFLLYLYLAVKFWSSS